MVAITLFWGLNWPAMKTVLDTLPVWTFRSICLIWGGLGLLIIARLTGRSLYLPPSERGPLAMVALVNVIGWHLFSGYGISLIPAGRAAIIAFTMPLWVALLSRLFLGETLSWPKIIGLALGMTGLGILIGPDLQGLGAAPLGTALMLGAALSWAGGTVLIKRHHWTVSTVTLTGWQLLIGALPIVPGSLLIDGLPQASWFTTPGILALAYVLLLPILFCQWGYFQLVRLFPAGVAAISMLAIPVIGVFSSALILGEATGPRELISLALVCLALGVVVVWPALQERQSARSHRS
jgi:drug/metabolite transporter (DMT)-like permease